MLSLVNIEEMQLKEIDIKNMNVYKKKCACYAKKGNRIVLKNKELYKLKDFTALNEHDGYYIEIIATDSDYKQYILWNDCETICVKYGHLHEKWTIQQLNERLVNWLDKRGMDGFKLLLYKEEKAGHFIGNNFIMPLFLAGEKELAEHYIKYRDDYMERQEERIRLKKIAYESSQKKGSVNDVLKGKI